MCNVLYKGQWWALRRGGLEGIGGHGTCDYLAGLLAPLTQIGKDKGRWVGIPAQPHPITHSLSSYSLSLTTWAPVGDGHSSSSFGLEWVGWWWCGDPSRLRPQQEEG